MVVITEKNTHNKIFCFENKSTKCSDTSSSDKLEQQQRPVQSTQTMVEHVNPTPFDRQSLAPHRSRRQRTGIHTNWLVAKNALEHPETAARDQD
jgi:hypothetical protein